jgi:hypothetical protein
MTPERADHADPLFVVDNAKGGRSGLGYLREWSELANSIDIATGFFEIGSLLDLDGDWQKFQKIRILMGDEVALRTKKALLEAVKQRAANVLDASIESTKEADPRSMAGQQLCSLRSSPLQLWRLRRSL